MAGPKTALEILAEFRDNASAGLEKLEAALQKAGSGARRRRPWRSRAGPRRAGAARRRVRRVTAVTPCTPPEAPA